MGKLFVTGRRKDLIIIGGSNYYPHDIELTAERSHKDLRPASCAAFSIDDGGAERLIVAIEVERHHRPDDQNGKHSEASRRRRVSGSDSRGMVMAIQRAVADEHELQIHQVVLLRAGVFQRRQAERFKGTFAGKRSWRPVWIGGAG